MRTLVLSMLALCLVASDATSGPFGRRRGGCGSGSGSNSGCSSCGQSESGSYASTGCATCGQSTQGCATCGTAGFGQPVEGCAECGYGWYAIPGEPNQLALVQNGKQVGAYDFGEKTFGELKADGSWDRKAKCAVALPKSPLKSLPLPAERAPAPVEKKTSLLRANGCDGCTCGCGGSGECNCGRVAKNH